jgi:MFS family permease
VTDTAPLPGRAAIRLGLRPNLGQFALLVAVNALVGGMIGQERTVLPLLAEEVFGLAAFSTALTFVVAFGVVKALTNLVAGALSDRYGRKPVLIAGWLAGLPVPLILMWAPSWGWVIAANVLLGANQGLAWSTTVVMKIDLVGPEKRGLAMGLNEAAGYGAVALTALATGFVASEYGLRPEPFFLGVAYAALGLTLSTLFVRETRAHVHHEAANHALTAPALHDGLSMRQVFVLASFRERALSACAQAGLVNNLNDGLAWGLFPLYFAAAGLSVGRIGVLAALYPAVWGLGQLVTGGLSDRVGRKRLIVAGMLVQAAALALIAATSGFTPWAVAAVVLGVGTAMVYPTLLAAVSDVAHPAWRASAVGVYRFWRDAGFAVGGLVAGFLADLVDPRFAIWVVAAITAASGVVVAVRMYETHPRDGIRSPGPSGDDPDVGAEVDAGAVGVVAEHGTHGGERRGSPPFGDALQRRPTGPGVGEVPGGAVGGGAQGQPQLDGLEHDGGVARRAENIANDVGI